MSTRTSFILISRKRKLNTCNITLVCPPIFRLKLVRSIQLTQSQVIVLKLFDCPLCALETQACTPSNGIPRKKSLSPKPTHNALALYGKTSKTGAENVWYRGSRDWKFGSLPIKDNSETFVEWNLFRFDFERSKNNMQEINDLAQMTTSNVRWIYNCKQAAVALAKSLRVLKLNWIET